MIYYGNDIIDGREVPPLILKNDYMLTGVHEGSIYVEGCKLTVSGTLRGTLNVSQGANVEIIGVQQGTVSVDSDCLVRVYGRIEGTTSIEQGGIVIIEENARLAGTLSNYGKFILRGVFGGQNSGQGELIIEGTGYIKTPTIKDGISYYEW